MNELDIFTDALGRTDPADRAKYLDAACAGNPGLRKRLEELLSAHARGGSPIDRPPMDPAAHAPTADGNTAAFGGDATGDFPGGSERVGAVLGGKYKLIEEVGEGGMGSVYMAQQTEPVKRAVAVKVIKAGMDSKAVLARFEAERQALAMMDHPNIAKVLDAGTTDGGRPFFVMELVKGVPITQFCDDRRLTPRQRLELFVPVCNAIQHAHQKGVIHRDIKPSNVLVALYDDRPVPKVIDFGVAKAAGQTLTDKTLMTGFGAVVGTPEYMSPEQASLNNLDIDTRSDVYALGVLLYELLTGTTPVDKKSLGKAAVLEVLRIVREVEAPRPSHKLSSSDALPSIATNRGTEPAKLSKLMKGELDWVVMKALEKDRTRRYDTANGLARDLLRYLADEIVEARPPSTGYRVRKFVRKYRRPLLAGAAAAAGLTVAAGVASWQAVRATRAQAETADALRQANSAVDFLTDAFKLPDPELSGPDLKVVDLLSQAATRLDADTDIEPHTRARLRNTLIVTYRGLGLARLAIPMCERARNEATASLGPDDASTLELGNELGLALITADRPADAVPILEDTRHRGSERLGKEHDISMAALNNLALAYQMAGRLPDALPLFEECYTTRLRILPADHKHTLTSLHNLALAYRADGRLDLAIDRLEECLRRRQATLGNDHPETLLSQQVLAQAYTADNRVAEAIPLLEANLASKTIKLGSRHRGTLNTTTILGSAYRGVGRHRDAIRLFEQSLRLLLETQGPDSTNTLTARNNLARSLIETGRPAEAVPLLEECVRRQTALRGADDDNTLPPRRNLSRAFVDLSRHAEAIRDLTGVLAVYRAKGRLGVKNMLGTMLDLAEAHEAAGRWEDAEPLWAELLPAYAEMTPPDKTAQAAALESRGLGLLDRQRYEPAVAAFRAALPLRATGSWWAALTRSRLGESLAAQGQFDEAGPLLRAGYAGLVAATSESAERHRPEAADRLIRFAERTNNAAELATWRAERTKYKELAPPPRAAK